MWISTDGLDRLAAVFPRLNQRYPLTFNSVFTFSSASPPRVLPTVISHGQTFVAPSLPLSKESLATRDYTNLYQGLKCYCLEVWPRETIVLLEQQGNKVTVGNCPGFHTKPGMDFKDRCIQQIKQ